jgi:DNA polymerase III delta subunit
MPYSPDCSLTEKYRPTQLSDLVFPAPHGVGAALQFCASPYPSAWLFHGRSGLGKTSMAEIMARIAAKDPFAIQTFSGPDASIDVIRGLVSSFTHRPLFGDFHAIIINESDNMPKPAQVRLLDALERLREYRAVIILTSNDQLDSFEDRLLARVKSQSFTSQGLATNASTWLAKIAAAEGISISPTKIRRIVKLAKNNLRQALQDLEVFAAEQTPGLPVITASQMTISSRVQPVANTGQAALI